MRLVERAGRTLRRRDRRCGSTRSCRRRTRGGSAAVAPGRKQVHDAAPDGELARFVRRVLPRVAGSTQPVAEIDRRDVHPGAQHQAAQREARRRRQAGQQRRPRKPPGSCGALVDSRKQRAGAGRRDVEVRRETAVRIDFRATEAAGRPARPPPVREPFERAQEEARVGRELLDVAVGGRRAAATWPRRRRQPRRRSSWRRRQAAHGAGGHPPIRPAAVLNSARSVRDVDVDELIPGPGERRNPHSTATEAGRRERLRRRFLLC